MSHLFAVEEVVAHFGLRMAVALRGLQDALRKLQNGKQFRPSVLCRVRVRTAHSMPTVRLLQSAECEILWRLRRCCGNSRLRA
jgi:hypothetical protein